MSAAAEEKYYFIDSNRAYRGPVTKDTLHFLFQTDAISAATYIYAEGLAGCNNSWVRLKRLPEFMADLSVPLPRASTTSTTSKQPDAGAPAAKAPAVAAAAAPPPREQISLEAGGRQGSASVPRSTSNPLGSDAREGRPSLTGRMSVGGLAPPPSGRDSQVGAASPEAAAAAPAPAPPHAVATAPRGASSSPLALAAQPQACLYDHFPRVQPSPARPPSAGGRKFGLWARGGSASKSSFSQPVSACPLDEAGVPAALSTLRQMLFDGDGHLVEGIFRVSPALSALKVARQHADTNQLQKIRDPESIAQLIKLWFRGLPESILAARLQPVVDGPPDSVGACAALVDELPQPNRATVRWLLQLLHDISLHEDQNRMTLKSLTVVFAPNLIDPPPAMPPLLALELNARVCSFLERVLEHACATGELRKSPVAVS